MTIRRRQVRGIIAGGAIAINSFPGTVEDSTRLYFVHGQLQDRAATREKGKTQRRGIESDYGSIRERTERTLYGRRSEKVHLACRRQTSETTSDVGEVCDAGDLRLLNSRLPRGYVIPLKAQVRISRGSNVPAMAAESGPGRLSRSRCNRVP